MKGNKKLMQHRTTKLLGFIINDSLSWKDHNRFICKKVQHIVYLLQHSRYVLGRATARTLYFQFVYCHLINGKHVYSNLSSNNYLNRIFLLQKWALHIIPIVRYIQFYFIPTASITRSSKILPLPKLAYYFALIFEKKINNL